MARSRLRSGLPALACVAALAACGHVPPVSPSPTPVDTSSVQRDVRATLQAALDAGGTSVSYAILQHGRIVLSDAVGYLDSTKTLPATNDTLYNVGSISKVVTTVAVMKLVDEGRVALDDRVVHYLPEFRLKDDRYPDITVRMLLNHSSGMLGSDYASGTSYSRFDTQFPEKNARYLANSMLKADPGLFSVYCNDGFEVAAAIVARVSGRPFDQFVVENVFRPLGMESAGYSTRTFLAGTYAVKGADPHEFVNVMGSGGVNATLSDLARFGYELLDPNPIVLSADSAGEMNRAQGLTIIADDTATRAFGLGWDAAGKRFADYDFGVRVLDKSGDTEQFASQLYVVPSYDLVGAISASMDFSQDVAQTLRDIMARVLREQGIETARPKASDTRPTARALPPNFEAAYAGFYGNSDTLLEVVVNADATLSILHYDGARFTASGLKYVFDGQDFAKSTGQKAYRFVTAAGRRYLMAVDEGMEIVSAIGQKLESSAAPLGAWRARVGRLFLPAEVALNAIHIDPGMTLATIDGLHGVLFLQSGNSMEPQAVVDDQHTTTVVQIPGANGRDLHTLTVEPENGEEWMAVPAYRLRPADSLPQLAGGQVTIPATGVNVLFRLPKHSLSSSIPGGARILAYDASGTKTYDSLLDGASPTRLPASGFIRFLGPAGTAFEVTVAGSLSGR